MRLIDADDFIAKTRELYNQAGWGFRDIHYSQSDVEMNLSMMPTIDPVKHGQWIDETFESWGLVHHPFKCNLCGEHAEFSSPYCPNCGAKMDGGGEKNDTD